MSDNIQHPKVFISYSWDSEEHKKWVLALSNDLIRDGTDCQIDQYVSFVEEGWPLWMERQIEAADFVLLVCTQKYHDRFHKRGEGGAGRGVAWEGAILTQILYDNFCCNSRNKSFIPVLPDNVGEVNHIPIVLRGYSPFFIPSQYEDLLRFILNRPKIVKPPLGEPPPLPPEPLVFLQEVDRLRKEKATQTEHVIVEKQKLQKLYEERLGLEQQVQGAIPPQFEAAIEWLTNRKELAIKAGDYALTQFPEPKKDAKMIRRFYQDLEDCLELIDYRLITDKLRLLDEPKITSSLPVEVYKTALRSIRQRIPPYIADSTEEVRISLDYLMSRLS